MEKQAYFEDRLGLEVLQEKIDAMKTAMAQVIVGQNNMVDLMMLALLADGHVLLEGVPGIAKTLTVKLLARLISTRFSRIQFTPDLMPSDVTGTTVFNMSTSRFEFSQGPVFSNIVLIDEINRAPAKTQSALFEVMEEKQVTADGTTYRMSAPFMVFATQNPLEHEGTYRLPEAQLDRFLFKIEVNYPSLDEEVLILNQAHQRGTGNELDGIEPVMDADLLLRFQSIIRQVHIDDHLMKYIASIVHKTRHHSALFLGASPRASINIMKAGKAMAAINGRDFVIPEDLKTVIPPVFIHRIGLTPEKEMEGVTAAQIIAGIIHSEPVPR